MAWGMTTKSDNKFWPIFFVKNFQMANKQSGNFSGQLVLNFCNLVLGTGGIVAGNIGILGSDTTGAICFRDNNSGEVLMTISPDNDFGYATINILNAISFFKNQNGTHSFKIGTGAKYCLFTDEGKIYCDYLQANGDVYSKGNLTATDMFSYRNGSKIIETTDSINHFGTGGSYVGMTTKLRGNTVRIYSHAGGGVYLGNSGSTAITSDENLKNISEIDEKYVKFFKNLKPITYVYKNKGHRSHVGFGARQVEEALTNAGLTTEQFAGVLVDENVTISADEAGTKEDVHYDELYSLRYEEFIALNSMMIQKQQKEIEELKKDKEQSNKVIQDLIKRIETLEKGANNE